MKPFVFTQPHTVRASAYRTTQVMPVAAVEIEVSPQSYEQQTKDGEH